LVSLILVGSFTSAQDVKTVVWPFDADSTSFNTITQAESVDSDVQNMVFPRLNMNNLETGLPEPYLTTWEISDDGLTYTFAINEDAVWSDGVPITSTDVLFTLNAMFSEYVETFRTIDGVDSMNAIDDKHFEIVLADSTCGLFSQIGVGIMPAHKFADDYSDFVTSEFNTQPDISGGPFIFIERSVDEYLRFEANDSFFMGRPEIDQLLVQVIVDPQVRIQAMQSGEADFLGFLNSEQIAPFTDNPNFTTHYIEANALVVSLFNHADPAQPMAGYDEEGNIVEQPPHPILGDPLVRKALVMGWDHEDAVFLRGEGSRRYVGPVAPILADAYNNDLELYPYDPDAAAALLDEAGWVLNGDIREKDGEPLALDIAYIANETFFTEVAAVMADYWNDLGIDVTLTTGEQGVMINETFVSQGFDVFIIQATWGEPTPDVLLNFLFNGHNDFGFNGGSFVDAEFDGLLAELTTADCSAEARQPIYYRLQEIMHEQAATDFLSTAVGYSVTSSRISNVEVTTWGTTPLWEWQVAD
jgi:peptide/nickel transport system substrate-binding protein